MTNSRLHVDLPVVHVQTAGEEDLHRTVTLSPETAAGLATPIVPDDAPICSSAPHRQRIAVDVLMVDS